MNHFHGTTSRIYVVRRRGRLCGSEEKSFRSVHREEEKRQNGMVLNAGSSVRNGVCMPLSSLEGEREGKLAPPSEEDNLLLMAPAVGRGRGRREFDRRKSEPQARAVGEYGLKQAHTTTTGSLQSPPHPRGGGEARLSSDKITPRERQRHLGGRAPPPSTKMLHCSKFAPLKRRPPFPGGGGGA